MLHQTEVLLQSGDCKWEHNSVIEHLRSSSYRLRTCWMFSNTNVLSLGLPLRVLSYSWLWPAMNSYPHFRMFWTFINPTPYTRWISSWISFAVLSRLNNESCYTLRHAQLHIMVAPCLLPHCARALPRFTLQFLQCYQKLWNIIISWFRRALFTALRFRV